MADGPFASLKAYGLLEFEAKIYYPLREIRTDSAQRFWFDCP
jgi:hypothetical protein